MRKATWTRGRPLSCQEKSGQVPTSGPMTMQNHHTGGCAMLVDEVGASLEAGKLRSAVEQAQKFTFTSDIIEAAQMMAPKITHEDMAQFSRLPFSTCWFELPDDGGPYKKTGFLLMAVDHNHRPAAFQTLRSIDPMLERAVLVRSFGLAREDNGIDSEDFGITFSNGRVGASKGGCMNDAKWLLGLMLILNTKNLIEQTEVDVSRLNKQRKRRGKRPLFSYHVCR